MPGGTDQTLRSFLWRASRLYPDQEIVARTRDGVARCTYDEYDDRTARLANALSGLGLGSGDRIGTFCWNHHRHFEAYFGVPNMGAQLHTINPLLSAEHIDYIVGDAGDRLIFVDPMFVDKLEAAQNDGFSQVERYVVMDDSVPDTSLSPVTDYESFVAGASREYDWPRLDEETPAAMCYTSGTTGQPKGVEFTHQMLWGHTMMFLTPQGLSIRDHDVVMPVVPMFHANAWGVPYACTAAGSKQVFPGPAPESGDLARLIEAEDVTFPLGVPSVWNDFLQYMQDNRVDLSTVDRIAVGGAAVPEEMIRRFDEHDVDVVHAWGMTEASPTGIVAHVKAEYRNSDFEQKLEKRTKQGLIVPGLEFKAVDSEGTEVEWNGTDLGELWIRGPWVTTEYFQRSEATENRFEDGWLKTGDIVTVDPDGYIEVVDRTADIIKSGGGKWACSDEWISSVKLENAVMAHEGVAEAAVIGVPHQKWTERPVAIVVPTKRGRSAALKEEIMQRLREEFPTWWLPDAIEFTDEIPKTATGKFSKRELRERYADTSFSDQTGRGQQAPQQPE